MPKKSSGRTPSKKQLALMAGAVAPATNFSYDTQRQIERPVDVRTLFKRCRVVAEESSFLSTYLPLKLAFYNAGFSIGLGRNAKSTDSDALDKWLNSPYQFTAQYTNPSTQEVLEIETNMTVGESIRRFIIDVWKEYLLMDVAIPLWDESGRAPVVAPPEQCRLIDKLGLQVLFYTHGLSSTDLLLLDPSQQDRYRQYSEVMINPKFGEHFKILKRGLDGAGFTKPILYSIVRTIAEVDYKEQGFHAQAFNMRVATRQHKLGHNYTQGPAAGKPTYFWSAARDKKVREVFKDRVGPHDFTSNFDHEIVYPWPDVTAFDEIAWRGSDRRLRNWGGPIAQMLLADKVIPGALAFLRAQVADDRKNMSDFILPIIKTAFKVPDSLDIVLNWSDLVFIDPTQASDLIKFGVQQGFCSVSTARNIIGLNNEQENALKLIEANDADATAHYTPAWDMAHGIAPQQGETTAPIAPLPPGGGAPAPGNKPNTAPTNTPPGEPGRQIGT